MPTYKAEKGKRIHSSVGIIRFDDEHYETENDVEIAAIEKAMGVEKLTEKEAKKVTKVKKSHAKKTVKKEDKKEVAEEKKEVVEAEKKKETDENTTQGSTFTPSK